MTRMMEMTRVRVTSLTEARMVWVRSSATWTFIAGGTEAWSVGSSLRTLSTVEMTLAPGDLKTTMRMAGVPFMRPPVWMFSTLSMTSATSWMRTTPWARAAAPVTATGAVEAEVTPEVTAGALVATAVEALGEAAASVMLEMVEAELPLLAMAEATLEGRPDLAVAELTGPLSVAMMRGL
jgi:hypothetical protein